VEISDKNLEEVINGCVLDNERLHFHIKTFILLLLHDKTGHVGHLGTQSNSECTNGTPQAQSPATYSQAKKRMGGARCGS
jgi:hypothetical protein